MNRNKMTQTLKDNGYTHRYSNNMHEWAAPNGALVATDGLSHFALQTAYDHYLDSLPHEQAPAPYFENPEMLDDYSGHDYAVDAPAPAPVDIAIEAGEFVPEHIVSGDFALLEIIPDVLAEKNERIAQLEAALQAFRENATELETCVAELKADYERAMELLKLLHLMDYTQEALDYLMSEKDYENYAIVSNGVNWLNSKQAPLAAPVQAEAVTLSKSDIDYLARCERKGEYFIKINDEVPPIGTAKLGRLLISDPNCKYYFLTSYYNTPANRNAIADRRAELGLS